MPLKFLRKVEQQHYIRETNEFIKAELEGARRQVAAFLERDERSSNNPRDVLFAESANLYLDSLAQLYALAERPVDGRPNPFRDRFLTEFPEIIYYLATAVYQRQDELPYRFFTTRAPESRFAPSEVALEYAVSIRAAEAVNYNYHDRFRSFYPTNPECRAPLVTLSGGPVATLKARLKLCCGMSEAPIVPLTPNELLELLRHSQNLSCIRLPRWSSQHIRTYALAAHEHMHRVLNSAQIITRAATDAFVAQRIEQNSTERNIDAIWSNENLSEEARRQAREEFVSHVERYAPAAGNNLATLSVAAYEFFQDVWRSYRKQAQSGADGAMIRALCGVPEDQLGATRGTEQLEPLRTTALLHTRELLADVGAILIAGPAFAFAFRTIHPIAAAKAGIAPGNHSHPSPSLRVWLHIHLLRRFRFERIATLLQEDLHDEWKELKESADVLDEACEKFFSSVGAGRDGTFDHLVAHITDATSDCTYDLRRPRAANVSAPTEEELLDRWSGFARAVEEERQVLSAEMLDMSPEDAINALWWKRLTEQNEDSTREARHRLAWRVVLRNYGRLREEPYTT
jgi:hypothetical protein